MKKYIVREEDLKKYLLSYSDYKKHSFYLIAVEGDLWNGFRLGEIFSSGSHKKVYRWWFNLRPTVEIERPSLHIHEAARRYILDKGL